MEQLLVSMEQLPVPMVQRLRALEQVLLLQLRLHPLLALLTPGMVTTLHFFAHFTINFVKLPAYDPSLRRVFL